MYNYKYYCIEIYENNFFKMKIFYINKKSKYYIENHPIKPKRYVCYRDINKLSEYMNVYTTKEDLSIYLSSSSYYLSF